MYKKEYDFLTWTSFPSGVKLLNDEARLRGWWRIVNNLAVKPSSRLRAEINGKSDNVLTPLNPGGTPDRGSRLNIDGSQDGVTYKWLFAVPSTIGIYGKTDWAKHTAEAVIPTDIRMIRVMFVAAKGLTWFDDLKIYQDGVLIYADDFSNWDPVIGAGVGAGILGVVAPAVVRVPEPGVAYEYQKPVLEKEPLLAVGLAGLGALVGGGIGLLNAMGLIPQIPIPTLEAPTEEPESPTQMGKYQITD